MEILEKDPIIAFYLKMSKSTEHETKLPLFSETMLRLAMKQVLRYNLHSADLHLYRKLVLFYYSNHYGRLDELAKIMRCFNEEELIECFAQSDAIVRSWNKFTEENLRNVIYKEAFTEILMEWCRRCHHLFGEVNKDLLQLKAVDVQTFLHWGLTQAKPWLRNFEIMLSNLLKSTPQIKNITVDDLELPKIFQDIKHTLNPLVKSTRPEKDSDGSECKNTSPPKKKARTEKIKFLNIEVINVENLKDVATFNKEDAKEEECDNNVTIALNEEEVKVLTDDDDKYEEEYIEDVSTEEDLNYVESSSNNKIKQDEQLPNEDDSETNNLKNSTDEDVENGNIDSKLNEETSEIIDYDTAMNYISALQAYALVHGHFEAIGLLDEVDSNFRVK